MFKSFEKMTFVIAALTLVLLAVTFSIGDAAMVSGRLVSTLNINSGQATTFFAGYSENEPVIIGPSTKTITAQDFANCTKDNVGEVLLEENAVVKRVTKFSNNGKEIMADILIEK